MKETRIDKLALLKYAILGLLVLWVGFMSFSQVTGFTVFEPEEEAEWQCYRAACELTWAQQNCGLTQEGDATVCKIFADGEERYSPIQFMDQNLLQRCLKATCVSEVQVRAADYPIEQQTQEVQDQEVQDPEVQDPEVQDPEVQEE